MAAYGEMRVRSAGTGWVRGLAALVLSAVLPGCGVTGSGAASATHGAAGGTAVSVKARAKATDYGIVRTAGHKTWAFIERMEHRAASFPDEASRPNGRQREDAIVAAFGTERPASRVVLLHAMPGWDRKGEVPVLLVHGALADADSAWMAPHGKQGLAPWLAARGRAVFAVTFAHRHGDNLLQAEHVAGALARIRELTGASRVDVVAHSKGVAAVRALASGVRMPWCRAYGGDIRKLVLLGGPLLGIDYTYRHPSVHFGLVPELDHPLRNAPTAWERMVVFGMWKDIGAQSFMTDRGNCFPGQAQLLHRWDKRFPLSAMEPDVHATYHGGKGLISESRGIDAAIEAGGRFIERLRRHPLPKGLDVAVAAGDRATMTTVLNETDGPSDGVVFVESATHVEDLLAAGADLVTRDVLPVNHMELLYHPRSQAWLADVLARPEL
ncbi:MAG: hypothetical protein VKO64_12325 [Candidatus Sericytochromatia bacterium]|nr:hypothetical protein [Candidatus Sericytochromatia bacterium]